MSYTLLSLLSCSFATSVTGCEVMAGDWPAPWTSVVLLVWENDWLWDVLVGSADGSSFSILVGRDSVGDGEGEEKEKVRGLKEGHKVHYWGY